MVKSKLDIEVVTHELPPFKGLERITKQARRKLDERHAAISRLAETDRKRLYQFGKLLTEIGDLLKKHKVKVWQYCHANGISRVAYYDAVRIYAMFKGKEQLLPLFGLYVQRQFARQSSEQWQSILELAMRSATDGMEITCVWLDEQVLEVGCQRVSIDNEPKAVPIVGSNGKRKRKSSAEEEENLESVEDFLDIPKYEEPQPTVRNYSEVAKERDDLCNTVLGWIQDEKKMLVVWMRRNSIKPGIWWRTMEAGFDAVVDAVQLMRDLPLEVKDTKE